MARMSMPRAENSRATSSTASSVGVTRTTPSAARISAMRRSRAPEVAPRLPFACGLTTTPMPGTRSLRRRARHGELAAGRLDVLTPALADGGVHAPPEQDLLEAHDARP